MKAVLPLSLSKRQSNGIFFILKLSAVYLAIGKTNGT